MKFGLLRALLVLIAGLTACAAPSEGEGEEVDSQSDAVRGNTRANAEALRLFDRAKADRSKVAAVSSRCRSFGTSTKVTISAFTLADGTALVDLHVQKSGVPAQSADTIVRGMPWLPMVSREGDDFGVDFIVDGVEYALHSATLGTLSTSDGVIELRCDNIL